MAGWLRPAIPSLAGEGVMTADTVELPGLLAEIEEVAGRAAALAVMADHGGTEKSFPSPHQLERNPNRYAKNWLVTSVGMEKALEIVREIFPAGGRSEIPSGMERFAAAARREFVRDHAGKLSTREIALRLGMTERGVRVIKASLRKAGELA